MKAHIYARTSTDNDNSLQKQIDKCIHYCKEKEIEVANIYTHNKSSRNMKNKNMLYNIMEKMNEGDILIINSICRFSRNMLGGLEILEELEKKKLKIYSIDDCVGYENIHERFRFRQIMNCAELETDVISHRIKQSIKSKTRLTSNSNSNRNRNRKRIKLDNNSITSLNNNNLLDNSLINKPLEKYKKKTKK